MKKTVIAIFIFLTLVTGVLLVPFFTSKTSNATRETYLRVHIRANSNSEEDQKIKYQVKDLVVSYLTPLLVDVKTVEEAKIVIQENLSNLSDLATQFLEDNGFSYKATAKLNNEYFPTRSYEQLTLDSGFYDALILELGTGRGNNWWCVVYPPLCFSENTNSAGVEYKSLIAELIKKRSGK